MRLVRLGKGFQKHLPIALHLFVVRVRLQGGGGERASTRLYRPPLASTPRVEGLVATRALVAHVNQRPAARDLHARRLRMRPHRLHYASTTASIAPASAAACWPLTSRLRFLSRPQAFAATRSSATCARSATTTSASPTAAIAASIGSASLRALRVRK